MIRFILGLVLVLGAVGTLDIDANASLLVQGAIAVSGLALMMFGVRRLQKSNG